MLSWALFSNPNLIFVPPYNSFRPATVRVWFKHQALIRHSSSSAVHSVAFRNQSKSSVHHDSLRVLEWDKLCDCVSSFARTALGREATKAQLWSLNQTYEESLRLLDETNAAVEMQKHGNCSCINVLLVQFAIHHARRSLPMDGNEAMAVVSLLECAENLQINLKAALKEDADWYRRFMPLTEVIMGLIVNRSLVKLIQQVIDEDGSFKDSAVGTPICVPQREFIDIGRIASIENNHKPVDIAKKGQKVAIKIIGSNPEEQQKMFGRHFEIEDELVSRISRSSIDVLKANYRDDLSIEDWKLVMKLKTLFKIQ